MGYKKVTPGPTVFFDCDDTLIMWNKPKHYLETDLIEIECRGHVSKVFPHEHNINLLTNLAERGHAIVVWSGGGADWAEAVVKALNLEPHVEVVTGKPQYYVDDIKDPTKWMGKHQYINMEGISSWAMDVDHQEDK